VIDSSIGHLCLFAPTRKRVLLVACIVLLLLHSWLLAGKRGANLVQIFLPLPIIFQQKKPLPWQRGCWLCLKDCVSSYHPVCRVDTRNRRVATPQVWATWLHDGPHFNLQLRAKQYAKSIIRKINLVDICTAAWREIPWIEQEKEGSASGPQSNQQQIVKGTYYEISMGTFLTSFDTPVTFACLFSEHC
jgi:hypothetical protein